MGLGLAGDRAVDLEETESWMTADELRESASFEMIGIPVNFALQLKNPGIHTLNSIVNLLLDLLYLLDL